jgi:hypothetical protein
VTDPIKKLANRPGIGEGKVQENVLGKLIFKAYQAKH